VGDMYWLAGMEYRFPLFRIDRGWGVLPAFLRALSANVFIDAGSAFTEVEGVEDVFDGTLVGIGAELRMSTFLVWGYGVTGRAGFATGLMEGGYKPISTAEDGTKSFDPRVFYFQLGGSF